MTKHTNPKATLLLLGSEKACAGIEMSMFGDWNASLDQLKDRVGEWVHSTGLMPGGLGGRARGRGARSWDDSYEDEAGGSRENFSSRIEVVHMHLNLAVRPMLISGGRNFEVALDILRESYADEPVFKWLLGNVQSKKDPSSVQRKLQPLVARHAIIRTTFPRSSPLPVAHIVSASGSATTVCNH